MKTKLFLLSLLLLFINTSCGNKNKKEDEFHTIINSLNKKENFDSKRKSKNNFKRTETNNNNFFVVQEVAEVDPQFLGGEKALQQFISDNLNYPEEARKLGEQGIVYVQFVVYKDGTLGDVQVIKGVSESIDAEAVRIVKAMPKWKSGKQAGKKVSVKYVMPIKFNPFEEKNNK